MNLIWPHFKNNNNFTFIKCCFKNEYLSNNSEDWPKSNISLMFRDEMHSHKKLSSLWVNMEEQPSCLGKTWHSYLDKPSVELQTTSISDSRLFTQCQQVRMEEKKTKHQFTAVMQRKEESLLNRDASGWPIQPIQGEASLIWELGLGDLGGFQGNSDNRSPGPQCFSHSYTAEREVGSTIDRHRPAMRLKQTIWPSTVHLQWRGNWVSQ